MVVISLILNLFFSDEIILVEEVFFCFYIEVLLIIFFIFDFSMLYNVICLVCIVVVIVFGFFYNLFVWRFEVVDFKESIGFVGKLKVFFVKLKGKVFGKKKEEIVEEKKEN